MIPKSPLTKMRGVAISNMTHPMKCKRCGKTIKKTRKLKGGYVEICRTCLNKSISS